MLFRRERQPSSRLIRERLKGPPCEGMGGGNGSREVGESYDEGGVVVRKWENAVAGEKKESRFLVTNENSTGRSNPAAGYLAV